MERDPWNVTGAAAGQPQLHDAHSREQPQLNAARPAQDAPDSAWEVLATASLVLGILSLVSEKIVFGVSGLVFGLMAQKRHRSDRATAGIVCSVISLALVAVGAVAAVIICIFFWQQIAAWLRELAWAS